jgi:putative SOS response-associated peptidase YedK
LFSILTTDANLMMLSIHPSAMPVILTGDDIETWLNAPREVALQLQHPAPNGLLSIVVVGTRKDALPVALPTT